MLVNFFGRSPNTNPRPLTNISDCIPISYPSVVPVRSFYMQHVSPTAEESSVFNYVCLPCCSFRIYISHFHLPPPCLGMRQLKYISGNIICFALYFSKVRLSPYRAQSQYYRCRWELSVSKDTVFSHT